MCFKRTLYEMYLSALPVVVFDINSIDIATKYISQ